MYQEKKEGFKTSLQNQNWGEVSNKQCPNEACDALLDTFFGLFNIHFPKRTIVVSIHRTLSWHKVLWSQEKEIYYGQKGQKNPNLVDKQYFWYYINIYKNL